MWQVPVIPATQETEAGGLFEAAVSHNHATALQPGQQSETLSQKNKKAKQQQQNLHTHKTFVPGRKTHIHTKHWFQAKNLTKKKVQRRSTLPRLHRLFMDIPRLRMSSQCKIVTPTENNLP